MPAPPLGPAVREETEALLPAAQGCGQQMVCVHCWNEELGKVRSFGPISQLPAAGVEPASSSTGEGSFTGSFTLQQMCAEVKEESDWMMTVVLGWHKQRKILRYDIKELVRSGGWTTLFHWGTVASNGNGFFVYFGVMLSVAALTTYVTLHGAQGDVTKLNHFDLVPFNHLMDAVNMVCTFTLAQFIVLCLGRWWSIRTQALQKVLDSFADLCMLLSCELRGKRWNEVKAQVVKYGFATIDLMIFAVREEELDLNLLVARGLLSPSEAAFLGNMPFAWQRPYTTWSWITRIVFQSLDIKKSAQHFRGEVTGKCTQALTGMLNISKFLDTQLPFGYVHMIVLLVNIQNLVHAVKSGVAMAKAYAGGDYETLVFEVGGFVLQIFIYSSLIQISCLILDPFGDNTLAFPLESYAKWMAASLDAALEAQKDALCVAEDGELHLPSKEEKEEQSKNAFEAESSRSWTVDTVSSSSEGGLFSHTVSEGSLTPR